MTVAPHPDDVRRGLREAAQRRSDAERQRAEAMHDTTAWLRRADEAGLTIVEMTALSGLSRPTIYGILRPA